MHRRPQAINRITSWRRRRLASLSARVLICGSVCCFVGSVSCPAADQAPSATPVHDRALPYGGVDAPQERGVRNEERLLGFRTHEDVQQFLIDHASGCFSFDRWRIGKPFREVPTEAQGPRGA